MVLGGRRAFRMSTPLCRPSAFALQKVPESNLKLSSNLVEMWYSVFTVLVSISESIIIVCFCILMQLLDLKLVQTKGYLEHEIVAYLSCAISKT